MSNANGLATALKADLLYVHERGPAAILPHAVPALAELAEAVRGTGYDGDPHYWGEAIEDLLHMALDRLPCFGRISARAFRRGLAELLGLGENAWSSQEERFGHAAAAWGYKNAEAVRKTLRKTDDGKVPVWQLGYDCLVHELRGIGAGIGFAYTGRYIAESPNGPKAGVASEATRTLTDLLRAEVYTICELGLRPAYDEECIPTLAHIAAIAIPDGDIPFEDVEALLAAVVRDVDSSQAYRMDMIELLDFGDRRGQPLARRREQAASGLDRIARYMLNAVADRLVLMALRARVDGERRHL